MNLRLDGIFIKTRVRLVKRGQGDRPKFAFIRFCPCFGVDYREDTQVVLLLCAHRLLGSSGSVQCGASLRVPMTTTTTAVLTHSG